MKQRNRSIQSFHIDVNDQVSVVVDVDDVVEEYVRGELADNEKFKLN